MSEQAILHRAEEYGQSRELQLPEIGAHTVMALIESAALGAAGGLAVIVFQGVQGNVTFGMVGTAAAVGAVVGGFSFTFHVSRNLGELRDGLRSYRNIESYAPPTPQPGPVTAPSSPIMVKPYGGEPYMLHGNERLALPDGRQTALGLNPPTLAAVLQEVITQHGGQWSRSRLMGLRIEGQRVTRALYEELTNALARSGFLQPQSNGGYALPPDIREYEDLARYLPYLDREGGKGTGTAGGTAGRREGGEMEDDPPPGRGVTLAEQRATRWRECGCDVKAYRG